MFLVMHVVYLALAIALYCLARERLKAAAGLRRRLLQSTAFAVLFAPGVFVAYPVVLPSFVLLSLILSILFGQFGAEFAPFTGYAVPIVAVWLLAFFFLTALEMIRARRTRG